MLGFEAASPALLAYCHSFDIRLFSEPFRLTIYLSSVSGPFHCSAWNFEVYFLLACFQLCSMCFCFNFFAGCMFKIDAYDLFSLWHFSAIDGAVFVSTELNRWPESLTYYRCSEFDFLFPYFLVTFGFFCICVSKEGRCSQEVVTRKLLNEPFFIPFDDPQLRHPCCSSSSFVVAHCFTVSCCRNLFMLGCFAKHTWRASWRTLCPYRPVWATVTDIFTSLI